MQRILFFLTLSLLSSTGFGSELEFALSDDTIETSYETFYAGGFGTAVSWLHADIDQVKSDNVGVGLYAHGKSGNFRSHLGGKAFWLHSKYQSHNIDMHGVALGGAIDAYIIPKLFISGSVHYAPNILTGGDFENYLELGARISFKLLPNADIFAGYRFLETEIHDEDEEIYKGGYVGFNFHI